MDDSGRLGIGALAAWAGVTTRTVRYYHRTGVLPEPPRTAGGYRSYGLEDLARLLRVRRLVALGLPLARVAEVLADAAAPGRLRDVLEALDADLERQEHEVRARRRSIRLLLDGDGGDAAAQVDRLRTDLLAAFGNAPAVRRELDVLQVIAHEAPDAVPDVVAAYRRLLADDDTRRLSARTAELFERLGTVDREDGLEDEVARGLADLLRRSIDGVADVGPGEEGGAPTALELLAVGGLAPAQQRAVERARAILAEQEATR
jgi:DNA-binding transcriptional MerR regulator